MAVVEDGGHVGRVRRCEHCKEEAKTNRLQRRHKDGRRRKGKANVGWEASDGNGKRWKREGMAMQGRCKSAA